MCLIIEKPAGRTIPDDYLVYSIRQNKDGCGLAVYKPGEKVRLIKGLSDPLTIARRANEEFKDCLVYVHMRWTTHGGNSFENTHPIAVPGADYVLMHKGVLKGYGEKAYTHVTDTGGASSYKKWWEQQEINTSAISDTREFAEKVLAPLAKESKDLWKSPAFHRLVGDAIGGDKMVFLGATEAHVINRGYGTILDGIWYSDQYSLPPASKPVVFTAKPFWKWGKGETQGKVLQSTLMLSNGRGIQQAQKYSKNKRMRRAEMKTCSYSDVCECMGLCYMQNSEEYTRTNGGVAVNHNETVKDVLTSHKACSLDQTHYPDLSEFGEYGIVYSSSNDEEATLELVSSDTLRQMLNGED